MQEDCRPTYARIIERLRTSAEQSSVYRYRPIETRSYPDSTYDIVLVERKQRLVGRPHVLVIAGFHGEEPSGPSTIHDHHLSWMAFAEQHRLNLTIIPCANPWGYDRNDRYNPNVTFTNGGFIHDLDAMEPEFETLKRELIASQATHYIDLHEDGDASGVYTYCFHRLDIGRMILNAMAQRIPIDPNPEIFESEKFQRHVSNGIAFDVHDGSSEDLMSHEPTCIVALAPETPTNAPLEARISAHASAVNELLHIAARMPTNTSPSSLQKWNLFSRLVRRSLQHFRANR